MERGGEQRTLPDGDDPTVVLGEHVDVGPGPLDPGSADEHRVERLTVCAQRDVPLEGVDLPPERVPPDGHVDAAERLLALDAILEPVGEHDHPGAGPERGQAAGDELAQRVHQLERGGQLPQRRRLAAGNHQPVDGLDLGETPHRPSVRTALFERPDVLANVTLQSEYTDDWQSPDSSLSPILPG